MFGSLEDVPDPSARLRALFQLVAHEVKPHVIYSELLKALDHPAVRPVIDRVSQRRLDYLIASFRQAGLTRTDAQHRARLAYAAYVGFLQLSLQLQQPKPAGRFRSLRRACDPDVDSGVSRVVVKSVLKRQLMQAILKISQAY